MGDELKAFVHLARGFGSPVWQDRWDSGAIIGMNERFPYGYKHAEALGCEVIYSKDGPEGILGKYFRLAGRAILGFDLVHAWRNRRELLSADVVWSHTESQSLSVLMLLWLCGARRPKTISQSVWLIDEWKKLGWPRRQFYKFLLRSSDCLTFLSPVNAEAAKVLFPDNRVEFVKFGITTEFERSATERNIGAPLKVMSAGNDRHRDWTTFIAAVGGREAYQVEVLTSRLKKTELPTNIVAHRPDTNEELLAAFDRADIIVVPLTENMHASGITVVLEAIMRGIPVVCSNVGGLDGYFDDREITFLRNGSSEAIEEALQEFRRNPQIYLDKARSTQYGVIERGPNSKTYAQRHVEISREIINDAKSRHSHH